LVSFYGNKAKGKKPNGKSAAAKAMADEEGER